jgi:4-amino-4-deoxy-L-arabinose transferase-like glycosyltransferase
MAARTRIKLLFDLAVLGLIATYFFWLGQKRFLATDEGFYLLAARLVMSGQLPYIDFFYPQMPLLPYLYGAWMETFGYTWTQARVFSSLLSLISAGAIYLIVRRLTNQPLAIFAIALFALSGLTIGWFTTAKTYSASTAFCLLSFMFLHKKIAGGGLFAAFIGGVFLGLTINVRLFYVALVPIFIIWLWLGGKSREQKIKKIILFLLGGAVTATPHLYYVLNDFSSYWFNNYEYHTLRSEIPKDQISSHRISVLQTIFGLKEARRLDGLQFALITIATLLHPLVRFRVKRIPDAAFFIGITLLLVSLTPVPVHLQYLSVVTPFFIICAMLLLNDVKAWAILDKKNKLFACCLLVCLGGFIFSYLEPVSGSIERHLYSGQGVHGVRSAQTDASRLETASKVAAIVNDITTPGESVLSQWPGYLLESHALPYPGTENQFWIRVAHRITKEERNRYKIADMKSFRAALKDPDLRVVIIRDTQMTRYLPGQLLEDNNFTLKADIEGIFIYLK